MRLAALAAAALLAAGCGGTAAGPSTPSHGATAAGSAPATGSAKTYTFGGMFPLTGPGAEIGKLFERGADMAIAQLSAGSGVDGWHLKMIAVDHHGTAQGGVQAMNQLVNLDHVPYVESSFASVDLAAQPVAAQNHVLLINVGGTANDLLNKPWLYNDQLMPPVLDPPLATYAYKQGDRRAATLASNDAYGQQNAQAFAAAWRKLGGTVTDNESFNLSATDFTTELTKIRASNPQVLFVVAIGDTQGLLVKQARALGLKAQILGPLATNGLIKVAGAAAQGFVSSGIAVDPKTTDAGAKAFLDAYRAKYGSYPEWDSGTAYEGVQLLASLIRDVVASGGNPRSGDALLKALQAHPQFHNYLSGGTVQLLPDHGSVRQIALQRIEGKQFVTFETQSPSAAGAA